MSVRQLLSRQRTRREHRQSGAVDPERAARALHRPSPVGRFHFLPDNHYLALSIVLRGLERRSREGEDVPIQLVETNLVGSRPGLIPRDIHVMDYLLSIQRVAPSPANSS